MPPVFKDKADAAQPASRRVKMSPEQEVNPASPLCWLDCAPYSVIVARRFPAARCHFPATATDRMLLNGCRLPLAAALAIALAGCAGAPQTEAGPPTLGMTESVGAGGRELTPDEKKVIADAVSATIKDPASANYRWSRYGRGGMPGSADNYCAMVNAKSSYGPYSGSQAYVVSVGVSNGRITSAVVGAIAGGKDISVVRKICKRYGLDPSDAV